ncbi:MAG: hypothetical protein ACFB2W_03660 [Leptolyngbyaceae cyanobacterium]
MSVAACKLLTYKGQYSPCHIKFPDVDTILPAIKLDDLYYSLFRRFDSAEAAMKALGKLAQQGDQLALTQKGDSYVMWALEPDAQVLERTKNSIEWPTCGPALCLILGDAKQYHQCYVQTPDVIQPMVAVHHGDDFYSVYQSGLDALASLELAAKFTRRGNRSAIASTAKGYAVCLWEPEASLRTSD